jgi:hypothetical protein
MRRKWVKYLEIRFVVRWDSGFFMRGKLPENEELRSVEK